MVFRILNDYMSMDMENNPSAFKYFHPIVADWFAESVGAPTDLQMLAWPQIASGEHVLISAPTGSGKTMAAFLWAINELITGKCRRAGSACSMFLRSKRSTTTSTETW